MPPAILVRTHFALQAPALPPTPELSRNQSPPHFSGFKSAAVPIAARLAYFSSPSLPPTSLTAPLTFQAPGSAAAPTARAHYFAMGFQ